MCATPLLSVPYNDGNLELRHRMCQGVVAMRDVMRWRRVKMENVRKLAIYPISF